MVLSAEEILIIEESNSNVVQTYFKAREESKTLTEQALLDQQLQCLISRKGTIVHSLNCHIVKNAKSYVNVPTTNGSAWNCDGPTNEFLKDKVAIKIVKKHKFDKSKQLALLKQERNNLLINLRTVISQELLLRRNP